MRPKTGSGEKISRSFLPDEFWRWLFYKILDAIFGELVRRIGREGLKRAIRMIGRAFLRVSPLLAIVLGFVFQKEVLAAITSPYFIWVSVTIISVVTGSRLYVHFRAQTQLASFGNVVAGAAGHGYNIVIGGLTKAAYDLSMGLLPFWENPWILVVLGTYYFLIVNVWWMKRSFGKMVRWKPTGQPIWRRLV